MKIVTVNLPESYVKSLDKMSLVTTASRSELIRQAIKTFIIKETKLIENLKKKLEKLHITKFFDYCINCGSRLDNELRENHFFHKNIEVFELKFCCSCYKKFNNRTLDEFPEDIIENILKKIKKYKDCDL